MKFHQLSVGSKFELAGEVYVKLGPLIAQHEGSGARKVVRRSAPVAALADGLPASPQADATVVAFDAFYAHCLECLEQVRGQPGPAATAAARKALAAARQQFMTAIGAPSRAD